MSVPWSATKPRRKYCSALPPPWCWLITRPGTSLRTSAGHDIHWDVKPRVVVSLPRLTSAGHSATVIDVGDRATRAGRTFLRSPRELMALRVTQLQEEGTAVAPEAALVVRRAALWGLLVSKLIGGWGVQWDIQWHVIIGRDSFWIPPHVMTYAGVSAAVLLSFGVLVWETLGPGPDDALGPRATVLGLQGTRGYHLAAGGI